MLCSCAQRLSVVLLIAVRLPTYQVHHHCYVGWNPPPQTPPQTPLHNPPPPVRTVTHEVRWGDAFMYGTRIDPICGITQLFKTYPVFDYHYVIAAKFTAWFFTAER